MTAATPQTAYVKIQSDGKASEMKNTNNTINGNRNFGAIKRAYETAYATDPHSDATANVSAG